MTRGGHRFLQKHVHQIDNIANRSVAELGLVGNQALVTVPPRMLTLLAFQASRPTVGIVLTEMQKGLRLPH